MAYTNLILKLSEKRIDLKTVAAYLDIDEKKVLNKIYGRKKTGLSWQEACKIHKGFLQEYEKEFLFYCEAETKSTALKEAAV